MINKTIVHLLSGGLDSVTMLYDLHGQGHSVHCLLFDYGQQHKQELVFAKAHTHRLGLLYTTITLPLLRGSAITDGSNSWVVPFRNPIMLAHAVNVAIEAKADTITIGCNADDACDFPDCQWAAIDALNHCIKISGYEVEICAPYIQKSKWEIMDMAKSFGVPMSEIWTCYKGGSSPCGECPACRKLEAAMAHK